MIKRTYIRKFKSGATATVTFEANPDDDAIVVFCSWEPQFKIEFLDEEYEAWMAGNHQDFAQASKRDVVRLSE